MCFSRVPDPGYFPSSFIMSFRLSPNCFLFYGPNALLHVSILSQVWAAGMLGIFWFGYVLPVLPVVVLYQKRRWCQSCIITFSQITDSSLVVCLALSFCCKNIITLSQNCSQHYVTMTKLIQLIAALVSTVAVASAFSPVHQSARSVCYPLDSLTWCHCHPWWLPTHFHVI